MSIKHDMRFTSFAKQPLADWLKRAPNYAPIRDYAPSIGIHDVPAIAHLRALLWTLSDYRVESVQGGVIWLAPLEITCQ